MNSPIIQEMMNTEKMGRLRSEGLYSQELRKAGIKSSFEFARLWQPVLNLIHAVIDSCTFFAMQARLRKLVGVFRMS